MRGVEVAGEISFLKRVVSVGTDLWVEDTPLKVVVGLI
jgi:hypothetical protein